MAKSKGRAFGQDLMNGEHVVGGGVGKRNLTWVNGTRDINEMDETSRKILSGGSRTPAVLAYGEFNNIEDGADRKINGTSVFDPVLCEIAYRWFCPPGGMVFDPFAGGSVRGIVARRLGRDYTGIELRPEQIAANRIQAERITPESPPEWIEGDSRNIPELLPENFEADFLFSCPPYADLEIYSDDPRDISAMDYAEFLAAYREIIEKAAARLRDNRFACFIVGDVRDKAGYYRGFPWHTVQAFADVGLRLYNEAVLVTAAGSLPLRVGRQFAVGRKFGKTHQNILVFCKGDWRKAAAAVGPVEFGEIDSGEKEKESDDPAAEFGEIL